MPNSNKTPKVSILDKMASKSKISNKDMDPGFNQNTPYSKVSKKDIDAARKAMTRK